MEDHGHFLPSVLRFGRHFVCYHTVSRLGQDVNHVRVVHPSPAAEDVLVEQVLGQVVVRDDDGGEEAAVEAENLAELLGELDHLLLGGGAENPGVAYIGSSETNCSISIKLSINIATYRCRSALTDLS